MTHLLVDELLGSLLSHESMKNMYDNSLENAFRSHVSISRGRGWIRSRGRGRSDKNKKKIDISSEHERRLDKNPHSLRGRSRKSSQPNHKYDKSTVKCFYHNKLGHYAHQCRKKKVDLSSLDANYANTTKNYEYSLFLSYNSPWEIYNDIWFLYSGCRNDTIGD